VSWFTEPTIDLIPECIQAKKETVRNRAAVEDLWDKGFELPQSWTNWYDSQRKFEIAYLRSFGFDDVPRAEAARITVTTIK